MNTTITDLLPVNSNIHGTPFEDLINNTIGYFLEMIEEEVDAMNDGCFIDTAEGGYLDLWGKEFNIPRLNDESDEDYCQRLLVGPLDRFTINTLYTMYDIQLLTYKSDKTSLTLLSDNHFLANEYFIDCTDEIWETISRKFITMGILHRWTE